MSDSDIENNRQNSDKDPNFKPIAESQFIASLSTPKGYDDSNFTNLRDDREEINQITLECCNPKIIEQKLTKANYVTYNIKGFDKLGEINILRRYSDFFELRAKLLQNWPGIFVPSIPGKKQIGNMKQAFIDARCADLDFFVKQCAKRPYIIYSEEFQVFLRNSSDNLAKVIENIKPESSEKMLGKYQNVFAQHVDMITEDAKIESFFAN